MAERRQKPVIVCFAGDVWDGNPHSRHHLARRLAGEFEVLFIEGVPMRSLAGGDSFELSRALRKLRAGSSLRTVADGLHVLRPFPIPPAGPIGRRVQLLGLRTQVLRALRKLALHGPRVVWFSVPVAAPLIGKLGEVGSIFYYQDRYESFSHVDVEVIRGHVATLASRCEVSIATSAALADHLRSLEADPVVISHAVDVERFRGGDPVPEDLARLSRPLVGYVGLIDDYLDFDCFLETADRLQEGTVVVVGMANTDVTALRRHPRIELLGRRPFERIPAYLDAFDVCLVPFRLNELTAGVNPIKLREYLAAGRPVVSTAMPEVIPYAPPVRTATGSADFAAAVLEELAPANDSEAARARRRERVAGESWDVAAERVGDVLRQVLSRQRS